LEVGRRWREGEILNQQNCAGREMVAVHGRVRRKGIFCIGKAGAALRAERALEHLEKREEVVGPATVE
jgi:hypothetical protein